MGGVKNGWLNNLADGGRFRAVKEWRESLHTAVVGSEHASECIFVLERVWV